MYAADFLMVGEARSTQMPPIDNDGSSPKSDSWKTHFLIFTPRRKIQIDRFQDVPHVFLLPPN